MFSDGTVLSISYGKADLAVWSVAVIAEGALFAGVTLCYDEDAKPYSDVARFRAGLKWAYAAKEWEKVR